MNIPRTATFFAAGLAALGIGIWAGSRTVSTPPAGPASATSAIVLPSPRPMAEFVLANQDGLPFTREQFKGHWSLLFAGFTHCPDVCPTTLGVMRAAEKRLPADSAGVQMIFLSVDPERDGPAELKKYVRYFSAHMIGVTGPVAELDKLTGSLGLAYMKVPGASPMEYSVDHSAAIALVNPQAQVAAYFQPPHQAEALAADVARIVGTVAACPGLEIQDGWVREAPPGTDMTAGYAHLYNRGSDVVTVDGVASAAFGDASLHKTELVNGSYQMTPMATVTLPPGGSVVLEPNGLHLMLMGPDRVLHAGEQVPVSFRCGPGRTTAAFTIRAGSP